MTNARPNVRQSVDPSTPKSRPKPKYRVRSSPQKRAPSLSHSAAAATLQTAHASASTGSHIPVRQPPPKRARSGGGREPEAKRVKPAARSKPTSPTTSSRSRPRKSRRDDVAAGSNVLAAATSASAVRRPVKPRAQTRQPEQLPIFALSIDGLPIPADVKYVVQSKRLFGQEIQCLIHAFGEVRYCSRSVLELVEDAVRDVVVRVARHATRGGTLSVHGVAECLQRDSRAINRLNQSLKRSAEAKSKPVKIAPVSKPWDIIAELGNINDPVAEQPIHEKTLLPSDMHTHCSYRAWVTFRRAMGTAQYLDFAACREMTLVRQESRSRAAHVRGTLRINLFRDWLNLPKDIIAPDEVLFALGHVAWEAIGGITQAALVHRYYDDLSKGFCDPRASHWTYGRHLVAALAYGLGTGIMVPLTDSQAAVLRQEIDNFTEVLQTEANKWRGYVHASSPCLLPCHIREALRKLEKQADSVFSFRENNSR